MNNRKKVNLTAKEKLLLEKIEQAKSALKSLREKRKLELGELAFKHGLADFDDAQLAKFFTAMATDQSHVVS